MRYGKRDFDDYGHMRFGRRWKDTIITIYIKMKRIKEKVLFTPYIQFHCARFHVQLFSLFHPIKLLSIDWQHSALSLYIIPTNPFFKLLNSELLLSFMICCYFISPPNHINISFSFIRISLFVVVAARSPFSRIHNYVYSPMCLNYMTRVCILNKKKL
jgi:hypothetical protein